jgi:hypothetical protein
LNSSPGGEDIKNQIKKSAADVSRFVDFSSRFNIGYAKREDATELIHSIYLVTFYFSQKLKLMPLFLKNRMS